MSNQIHPRNQGPSSSSSSSTTAPMIATEKIRFLCLHGYRQNADSFRSKLGSFRKHVQKYAEFVFINAPHKAAPLTENTNGDQQRNSDPQSDQPDQLSWWSNKDDGSFKGTNKNGPAVGFETSLRLVEKAWQEQGPFQGLLGFSQGACFVGLLCSLSARKMTKIQPEFVILSSGFQSGSLCHLNYYEQVIDIPSLHIFGESDDIIPGELSESLSAMFLDPQILKHPGGHYFPATSQQKPFYVNYFQDILLQYLEAKELRNATEANSVNIMENTESGDDDDS